MAPQRRRCAQASVTLPSGREGRLRLLDRPAHLEGDADGPDAPKEESESMRVDVRVDGTLPLSEQDVFALACRVINMSAKRKRNRGCREPFKHLLTVGEICGLLHESKVVHASIDAD